MTNLSPTARSFLGISPNQVLPADLGDLYDRYFAGRSYRTRFSEGWEFEHRGLEILNGRDRCLFHLIAQFDFSLDSEFRVYVECSGPVQIASSFISLVERDAILCDSVATGKSRRGLGQFKDCEAFFAAHGEYVSGWREADFDDKSFKRLLIGPTSVIGLGRIYSDKFSIVGIEYY